MAPALPVAPGGFRLKTPRLDLCPTGPQDAARALAIQADAEVARMLRHASFPPDFDRLSAWFATHPAEWTSGTAFRFSVCLEGRMIGIADIDEIADGCGELGYWFERAAWGQGLAMEAASALTRFAFETLCLDALCSGHAEDNPASGRILQKLGFTATGSANLPYLSRKGPVRHMLYRLRRQDWPAQQG